MLSDDVIIEVELAGCSSELEVDVGSDKVELGEGREEGEGSMPTCDSLAVGVTIAIVIKEDTLATSGVAVTSTTEVVSRISDTIDVDDTRERNGVDGSGRNTALLVDNRRSA